MTSCWAYVTINKFKYIKRFEPNFAGEGSVTPVQGKSRNYVHVPAVAPTLSHAREISHYRWDDPIIVLLLAFGGNTGDDTSGPSVGLGLARTGIMHNKK
jgi:hypothetical protein